MKPSHARRIRFGILAARHMLERHRLTDWQVDDLEGMESSGWKIWDSLKAFDHECDSASWRQLELQTRTALRAHGHKAVALRKKWLA